MSLKNTYGFSGSLLDAVSGVLKEEKCLCDCGKSPCEKCGKDHHEMDEGYVSHAQRKAVWASRNDEKKNKIKEEVEDLDELKTSTIKSYTKKAVSSSMTGQGGEKRVQGIGRAMDKLSARKKEESERGRYIPSFKKASNEEVESQDEVINEKIQDKMYPYQANQAATSMVTLVAMLRYLKATGMLQKLMKEDIELAGVFFGEEVRDEMYDFMEANKSAFMIMHKDDPKKSDPDSDDHEDAYKPASGKDQPHVMNQLAGAADAGGRHIDTAKGKRYVSGSTAKKLHGALMRAKPEERAKLSSNLYKNSHSAIEKDHADAVKRGVKPPAEKKGRGRPKKVQ
jgi:hypothetical protein